MNSKHSSSRRHFLEAIAVSAFGAGLTSNTKAEAREDREPDRAKRPQRPYRVWFQPRLFDRNIGLYANMTVDASGWLDPRLAEAMGKTSLDWVYGLQHPWAKGSNDWKKVCLPENRTRGNLVSAGIAVDEWVPPRQEQNPEWLAEGLRAGKRADPEIFIAVWITDPTPPLFELVKDGTVDLVIVEGYTHVAPEDPAGWATSWEGGLRRCRRIDDEGLIDKTIFSFGHIAPEAQRAGKPLTEKWLRERAEELKSAWPAMPGVAFFQRGESDAPEFRELVRACDRISAELWPDEME